VLSKGKAREVDRTQTKFMTTSFFLLFFFVCRSCWFLKFIFTVLFICILPFSSLFKFCFEVYFKCSPLNLKCSPLNQILKIIIKHRALHYVINLFWVLPKRIHYIYIQCYLFHAACAILLKILILRREVPLWRLHLTVQCQELTKLWAMVPTIGLQKTLGSHVEGAHTCCK
jgi:hypothetical protein